MQKKFRILVINPNSHATKIGVFENGACLLENTLVHPAEELRGYRKVMEQDEYRKTVILDALHIEGINISKFDAVCGRGGLLRPISGGTYQVNQEMLQDLKMGFNGEHASNLGGIISFEIAEGLNIPAYIVDPVVVDELQETAKVTGVPEIQRKSIFHALNQKAIARRTAAEIEKRYDQSSLIVVHLGNGITVGAHKNGRVIDVNNGLHGEGPFSPERAGTVPAGDLVSLCFSGQYTRNEVMEKLAGKGGLAAYFPADETEEVDNLKRQGDKKAILLHDSMAYQVAKEIGSMSCVLHGKVDAIALTGPLAKWSSFVAKVSEHVNWIADVFLYPGEDELQALAEGTLRVLTGEEKPGIYPNEEVSNAEGRGNDG